MADQRTRLKIYLPGMTNEELDAWLIQAANEHGYSTLADVPDTKISIIIHYARYIALQAKAAETAENAALNIKGVGVNKSGASSNYAGLIARAWTDYRRSGGRLGAVIKSSPMTRSDGR